MSSSGSSGGGGFSSGQRDELDCNIVERISLASPVPAVVATLTKGDKLNVQIRTQNDRDSVVARAASGQIAGAIILSSVQRTRDLIECLRAGRQYDATVIEVKGGLCSVEVRPRP
jgi:DNA-directed RNA polymerase alpha subunit